MNLKSKYPLVDSSEFLIRTYVHESLLTQRLNEGLEIKEVIRDVVRGALDVGAIALTGGMGGDTVVDIIFAVEGSTAVLAAVDDTINSAGKIADALQAAMQTNISQGADAIYTAVKKVVDTLAESGEMGKDLVDEMVEAVQALLNKLISAVSDWVATMLPDDAGLGGIIVREMLEQALQALGENVYDVLKKGFGALPGQAQEFIKSPSAMTAFLNEIAEKIVTYLKGDDEEGVMKKIAGAVKTATAPGAALISHVAKKKALEFLEGDFPAMIPKAVEILNKLITAFFGAVALAQILARWDKNEELEETYILREYIRMIFEANEYSWEVSNKKNMLLDKEGMEQSDKDNQEAYLKSMGLMEGLTRGQEKKWEIKESPIHGVGIFASEDVPAHTNLGPAQIKQGASGYHVTDLGKHHNHSDEPTCYNNMIGNTRYLYPLRDMLAGEEVTIDYTLQPDLEQPQAWW